MTLLRNLYHGFHRQLSQLGNHLLPTQCLLCGCTLSGELLCEGCLFDLPWIQRHEYRCRQCALALQSAGDYCGQCLKHPPAFSRSFMAFAYRHPLNPLIHRFKYRRTLASGKLLGRLFAQYMFDCAARDPEWQTPDLLVPTPMHWTRRWQRGFNQADILATYLSRSLDIPVDTRIVQRQHPTPAQKGLSRSERQKNLRDAFYLSAAAQLYIRGKSIALVDDVVTTTATVRELSRLFIKAGAKNVQVWALARTMDE